MRDNVLTRRHVGASVLLWFAFLLVLVEAMTSFVFRDVPTEIIALLAAASLLPLWAAAQAPWSYASLRHA